MSVIERCEGSCRHREETELLRESGISSRNKVFIRSRGTLLIGLSGGLKHGFVICAGTSTSRHDCFEMISNFEIEVVDVTSRGGSGIANHMRAICSMPSS